MTREPSPRAALLVEMLKASSGYKTIKAKGNEYNDLVADPDTEKIMVKIIEEVGGKEVVSLAAHEFCEEFVTKIDGVYEAVRMLDGDQKFLDVAREMLCETTSAIWAAAFMIGFGVGKDTK